MKVLSFAAALLMSSVALAYPAVSDYSRFSGTMINSGSQVPFGLSIELTNFDAASGTYTSVTTLTANGGVQTKEETVAAGDLVNRDSVLALLANCEAQGGAKAQVTVPAGTFESCTMTSQNSDGSVTMIAIADVPFGIVQMHMNAADGSSTHLDLEETRSGNSSSN